MTPLERRDEIAEEQRGHWVANTLNLGQYRVEYECACGEKWVADGHSTEPQPDIYGHRADALMPRIGEWLTEAWTEGHAAGRDYQGDGWNCDQHDPQQDNPYRKATP